MNRKERRRAKQQQKAGRRADPKAPGILRKAHQSLEAGDLAAAERGFREVTERDPLGAEAFNMLALIAYQQGRMADAGEMILEAITRDDSDVAMHANCGAIMNLLGRAMEAEAACRHVIDMRPGHAEAHNNLAVALEAQGRLDEALEAARRAADLDPDYVEARINLGNITQRMGDPAAAIGLYDEAIALAPGNAMAHANKGVALRETGALEAAEAACLKAIEASPTFPEAHNVLGNVRVAKGDPEGAVAAFAAALEARPGYVEARLNLAAAWFRAGDGPAAEREYRNALERNPNLAEAHAGLGVVHLAAGRLGDAVAAFRRAVELKPALGDAQYALATAAGADITEAEAAALRDALADDKLAAAERAKLHFALGEIADQKGEPEAAFAEFEAGNRIRKDLLAAKGHAFDADAFDRETAAIAALYDAEFLARRKGQGAPAAQPVFVVGMPRSGTTLVEQIAASHPEVAARGEMDLIRVLAGGDPGAARGWDADAVGAAAEAYLARLGAGAEGALRIVDKTPFNFLYLGLIQVMLPGARIVHCRRDAADTGLSCYFQNFTAPHAWACDLGDIGRYRRACDALMEHWRGVLSLPVLDVRYEDLVADQEGQSRALIEFLGLEWDAACLDFHRRGRAVLTASNWQVRKPLYASAVGRAGAYEKFLGPLKTGPGG